MPDGQILEFSEVTKRFGGVDAVAGLTASIGPGVVTGFLGPNGAGKTTSLRILLGLVTPTSGRARIGGAAYADLRDPLRTVGAALEASSFHPGRSGANHLKVYAQAAGLPASRIDETLGLVGLADAAGRKVGGYSLGMRQRLGLATALLGDPGILVLDEPSNGLDPEGIKWMRTLLRSFAAEGRTVLVSSHLLAEIQQTADRLLILARGRLVFEGGIEQLADPDEYATIVDAPDREALAAALAAAGHDVEILRSGLTVRGTEPVEVGALAAAAGIALSTLTRRGPALEEIFLALVDGSRVHVPGAVDAGEAAAAEEPAVAEAPVASEEAPAAPGETAASEETAVAVADAPDTAAEAPAAGDGVAEEAAPADAAIPEPPAEDDPLAPENDPAPEVGEITEAPDVEVASDTPPPADAAPQEADAPHPHSEDDEEGRDR